MGIVKVDGAASSLEASDAPSRVCLGDRLVRGALDAESAAWVESLASKGPCYEDACRRLYAVLLGVARKEAFRRADRWITGPELNDLAHQAAADALLRISGKVEEFRGDSRFTTWASRFVILEVSTKVNRHFWRNRRVWWGVEDWDQLLGCTTVDPAHYYEAREIADALRDSVIECLSPRQRLIFEALAVNRVSLDALTAELNVNRNALYKSVFDIRKKLKERLVADGYLLAVGPVSG